MAKHTDSVSLSCQFRHNVRSPYVSFSSSRKSYVCARFFSSRSHKPYVCARFSVLVPTSPTFAHVFRFSFPQTLRLLRFEALQLHEKGRNRMFCRKGGAKGERPYVLSGEDLGRRSGRMFFASPLAATSSGSSFQSACPLSRYSLSPAGSGPSPFPALLGCSNRTAGCPAARLTVHSERLRCQGPVHVFKPHGRMPRDPTDRAF